MIYRLIVLSGSRAGEHITIGTAPMVIGSGVNCDLRFCDEELAPEHAVIEHRVRGVFVRDLASMTGVILNNRRISEARLKHGDILELGRTCCLVEVSVRADVKNQPRPASRRRRVFGREAVGAAVVLSFIAYGFYFSSISRDATPKTLGGADSNVGVLLEPLQNRSYASENFLSKNDATPPGLSLSLKPDSQILDQAMFAAKEDSDPKAREAALDLKSALEKRSLAFSMLNDINGKNPTVFANDQEYGQLLLVVPGMTISNVWDELLLKAQQIAALGRLADADHLLKSLQIANPDFWPAYEERARLFEQRGLLKKAIDQWSQLVRLCSVSNWREKGVGERQRILEEEGQISANPQKKVRMASVEEFKFPPAKDSEETRAINISLIPTSDFIFLDPDAVKVQVVFYDLVENSETVIPTEAGVVIHPLHPDGEWPKDETKVVTATYTAAACSDAGSGQYYGYCARVYYYEQLQDEVARPKSLLALADKKENAKVSVVSARSGK